MDLSESHTKFSLEEHSSEGAHDRGSVRLSSALQLLQEDTGRSISAQANSTPQDSFFSFLLLRHLRIRDLRSKVLCDKISVLLTAECFKDYFLMLRRVV